MQYEITISGRRGTESEVEAQEVVRLLVSAFKSVDASYNLDIWNTKNNTVVMAVHGVGKSVPVIQVM
ncbi:hypothetical protein [Paramagnetospirillum magnetotacticum]|uniref:hypothetical protein n=1 Tax=Paramagnetospirillum magnetotacticum TaxID=188 RepID=UPI0002EF8AD9|nr:hypothetical protein [Paramagnetospirillum magnetotacticum]